MIALKFLLAGLIVIGILLVCLWIETMIDRRK